MNNNNTAKNLALAGMFLALGIIIPRIFHIFGPQGGKMFLPLFWGVILSALILPKKYTILIAIILPILSNLISAMPPVPMLYFMIIELLVYGIIASILAKKINMYLAVAIAIIFARISYIFAMLLAVYVLNLPVHFSGGIVLFTSVLVSLPGIIMQIIFAPYLYKLYAKKFVK